jgi:hypothetical protein
MMLAAKALQLAKPKLFYVAAMVLTVVHDVSHDSAALGFAQLAQRMRHEVVSTALAPA